MLPRGGNLPVTGKSPWPYIVSLRLNIIIYRVSREKRKVHGKKTGYKKVGVHFYYKCMIRDNFIGLQPTKTRAELVGLVDGLNI